MKAMEFQGVISFKTRSIANANATNYEAPNRALSQFQLTAFRFFLKTDLQIGGATPDIDISLYSKFINLF